MPLPVDLLEAASGVEIAPLRNGRELSGLLDVLGDSYASSDPWSLEQSQVVLSLVEAIEYGELDPPGYAVPPTSLVHSLGLPPSEVCVVVAWGDALIVGIGLGDASSFDPAPTTQVDEWDWTGGLSEDQLLGATGLRHSVVSWPRSTVSQETRVAVTRAWERLSSRVEEALALERVDVLGASEFRTTMAVVSQELRSEETSSRRLRTALAVLSGLGLNLLSSAAWDLIRPFIAEIGQILE